MSNTVDHYELIPLQGDATSNEKPMVTLSMLSSLSTVTSLLESFLSSSLMPESEKDTLASPSNVKKHTVAQ